MEKKNCYNLWNCFYILLSNIISNFQEHQFSTGSPNHNSLLMLEAEDVLSKLEISCLGMLLCEIGFDSKAKIDDEIYLSLQESIG